ncbi:prephenate dehydratase domain-containing protein [Proteus mirabilis]|uniref:prephenate dehydratase domain-containing protein n=1 Tax=Proteus mirabilis TaxID=584 RepID=UPI000D143969|nr:prephenate dehydratase domain-containing protein [Proteus mirabilis]MDM3592801.1 hypothetical protein [Proteus mirabilis]
MINIHTLGPAGTNCEKAAYYWLNKNNQQGNIILHPTLETAVKEMEVSANSLLLGCIVYPFLHNIVFNNLSFIKLTDCFVMDTHNMLFASRFNNIKEIKKLGSHPAPQDLFRKITELDNIERVLFNSNSEAALQCGLGRVDGCITTLSAAKKYHLNILYDFGPVPMGFSIHSKLN